jgi:hypothetical protein
VTNLRGVLSGVAAIVVALLRPGLFVALRDVSTSKATGLGVTFSNLQGSLFSSLFWILAVSFFALFFAASRLPSKPLRILLFWTPVTAVLMLGLGISSLVTYAWISEEGESLKDLSAIRDLSPWIAILGCQLLTPCLLRRELFARQIRRPNPPWETLRPRDESSLFLLDVLSKCNRTSSRAGIDEVPFQFLALCR